MPEPPRLTIFHPGRIFAIFSGLASSGNLPTNDVLKYIYKKNWILKMPTYFLDLYQDNYFEILGIILIRAFVIETTANIETKISNKITWIFLGRCDASMEFWTLILSMMSKILQDFKWFSNWIKCTSDPTSNHQAFQDKNGVCYDFFWGYHYIRSE